MILIASAHDSQGSAHALSRLAGLADRLTAHEAGEGFVLGASRNEASFGGGPRCPASAPVRAYDVAAIAIDITYNRYLDHDPLGRMFVLEADQARARDEEATTSTARVQGGQPAVSIGLQGDAIQPLVLRVNQGECLRISLHNRLPGGEVVGIHLHGSSLTVEGGPAIATNPKTFIAPGSKATYQWMVATSEPEGTHYFHNPGDDRVQTQHGLFGAVIVEPKSSRYMDPLTGADLRSGWQAIIRPGSGHSFREAVLFYHEVGDEQYQMLDASGRPLPLVDPFTNAYRPAARALNYRSEPFMDRLRLQQSSPRNPGDASGFFDESLSYSSYAFGDPATPLLRSYLGDPLRQRIIHGGSEVFHVHHVHGGAIRWLRQPGEETLSASGLQKHPPLVPQLSERIDSQSIGPSETYDIENECGSGGCQQSVGDYLYHCHIAHHYFGGMWGIWRVYNTKQDGPTSTDSLPPLGELPDRQGFARPAVGSDQLVGKTVDWSGKTFTIAAADLPGWVERQLPPQGHPQGYDASVLDWSKDGTTYLNELDSDQSWPGYRPSGAGIRPRLQFDPVTGKLAYPFLHPHLGKRPPFAPGHNPAPYLDPIMNGDDPAVPGANGPASVCPTGTNVKTLNVVAARIPVPINRKANLIDPGGELFVLQSEETAARATDALKIPLVIRANAGQDCVDVTLKSELDDNADNPFSKVNLHIHFVQFDVQGSDGVITGFNYEQSIRPYAVVGERFSQPANAGDTSITLTGISHLQVGADVGVGMDRDSTFEVRRITAIAETTLQLDHPLRYSHTVGEYVSTEFVRQRWYPDVQFGTAYFHDHVNAIASWRHGLFGALISEPPDSTYTNPKTGAPVESGAIADIHTTGTVYADVQGSFRELALFIQDDNPLTVIGRSSGSSYNLRAEPLAGRASDPSQVFSSRQVGDPATPILDTYLGDPVVVRLLVGGTNDVHTWHLDGHWFRAEPYSTHSPPIDTVHLGISERYDLAVPAAGGPQQIPGDYLFYSGRSFKLAEGSWGIFRVHNATNGGGLLKLPGHENTPATATSTCPTAAPQKHFAVDSIEAPLPMLGGAKGRIYVLDSEKSAVLAGKSTPQPLVLHVDSGDCVVITLRNELSTDPVTFHTDMLAADPNSSGGVSAGDNSFEPVRPGETRQFMLYAQPALGQPAALVRDFGNVTVSPGLGLYGAIVVGPAGATYSDPETGAEVQSGWKVDVHPAGGPAYRDFTLFIQDDDAGIGTHKMPYTRAVDGAVGINYRFDPVQARRDQAKGAPSLFSVASQSPKTPVLLAYAGDPVRIHVLIPWSEQGQVFSIEGHRWPQEPGTRGTNLLSSVQVGGLEAVTLDLEGGAGGPEQLAADYIYSDHRTPYRDAGLWGVFRVLDPCSSGGPRPLRPAPTFSCAGNYLPTGLAVGVAVLLIVLLTVRRRRARRQ